MLCSFDSKILRILLHCLPKYTSCIDGGIQSVGLIARVLLDSETLLQCMAGLGMENSTWSRRLSSHHPAADNVYSPLFLLPSTIPSRTSTNEYVFSANVLFYSILFPI